MATPVNDLAQLNPDHVDAALLREQEAHFVYIDHYLAWVNYEGRAKAGKIGRGQAFSDPTPATQTLDFKADVGAMFGGH